MHFVWLTFAVISRRISECGVGFCKQCVLKYGTLHGPDTFGKGVLWHGMVTQE